MQTQPRQESLPPDQQQLPRVRRELRGYAQIYDGQPYWVLKDPVSLRYYRFSREEYFIIQQLQKGVTLEQLKERHRREFRTDRLNNTEVARFVQMLAGKSLVAMQQPDRDETLYRLSKRRQRAKWISRFTNYLFFKIPVFDPDKLLDRIWRVVRFLWTWPFFAAYMLLLAAAVVLLVHRWHDFADMFQNQFFTMRNVWVLFAVIWFVKGLHEFGHGLTCKNYGGEVHEMGWLFLVLFPFFYCNVTDSWTFPQKRHRILVTAGGIMTELMFAALAAVIWYFTEQPAFIHTLTFNLLIACSFQTVLFNANPLLRFDGYYILMDLIEVPNLRQRSSSYMGGWFRRLLGGHSDELPEEHRFRFVFPFYAVCAYLYRCFIMFAILYAVYRILDGWHLVWLGRFLVTVSVVTMMVFPLVRGAQRMVRQRAAMGISNVRLLALLALLTVAAAVVLFWPLEQQVTLNFILEPARVRLVRSEVDGKVDWSPGPAGSRSARARLVQEGVWLAAADEGPDPIVARLANPRLLFEQEKLTCEIDKVELQLAYHVNRRHDSDVQRLRKHLVSLNDDYQRICQMVDQLEVRAPFGGKVLSAREEHDRLRQRYVPRGAPLFLLADTRELTATVWVPEKTLARIFREPAMVNQRAELMLYAFSGEKFHGRVAGPPSNQRQQNMGEFGEKLALSNKVGGEVITDYDPLTEQERPVEPVYQVSIALDSAPASARPYMSGRVRIDCGKSTLYQWGRESLLRFISPQVRL